MTRRDGETVSHTPGPWHFDPGDGGDASVGLAPTPPSVFHEVQDGSGEVVEIAYLKIPWSGVIPGPDGGSDTLGDVAANGALLAAAPDLLTKLKEIHSGMACSCRLEHFVGRTPPCATCQILAVIQKAEGSDVR